MAKRKETGAQTREWERFVREKGGGDLCLGGGEL